MELRQTDNQTEPRRPAICVSLGGVSTDAGRLFAPETIAYFWNNVDKREPDDCWLWLGPIGGRYGHLREGPRHIVASRLAYSLHFGTISNGLYVCHKCDNPLCCNPAHLFLGTCKENMQDAKRKGRMAFGIRNGRAKLDDDKISTIRLVLMCGESKSSIARRYGVCPPTIHKIAIGKNWKHVGEGKI